MVIIHNFLDDGETNPGAGILVFAMQALKDFENFVFVNGWKADAIVRNGDVAIVLCR